MADIGVCFYHLTDAGTDVPAVTAYDGTLVCEECAHEWRTQLLQRQAEIEADLARSDDALAGLQAYLHRPS